MEENREDNNRKRTIIIMVALMAMFVVGIIIRWDYISGEITASWQNLFSR